MSLDLDALDAQANLKPFAFTLGGKEHLLPNSRTLTAEQVDRYDDGNRRDVLAELIGEDVVKQLWALRVTTLSTFLTTWLAHGGLDLGEGDASEPSSKSTEAPSAPTSGATTA